MRDWVRNKGHTGKFTSNWHILHSMRATPTEGFALTLCGYLFKNPTIKNGPPNRRIQCSGCSTIEWALDQTTEVPEELIVRE